MVMVPSLPLWWVTGCVAPRQVFGSRPGAWPVQRTPPQTSATSRLGGLSLFPAQHDCSAPAGRGQSQCQNGSDALHMLGIHVPPRSEIDCAVRPYYATLTSLWSVREEEALSSSLPWTNCLSSLSTTLSQLTVSLSEWAPGTPEDSRILYGGRWAPGTLDDSRIFYGGRWAPGTPED